jgi:hypothetical protein
MTTHKDETRFDYPGRAGAKHGRRLHGGKGTLRDEQGIILVVVMFLVAAISLLALAAGRSVKTDTAVAGNYLGTIRALYMAEAGLERAKNECAMRYIGGSWASFNSILAGGGALTFGTGNIGFHGGHYSAVVLNDYGDSGGSANDTNRAVTIEATGTFGSSTAKVRSTIKMNELMNLPGAVNLVGGYTTSFTGSNSFTIDGRDYKISDTTTPTGTASTHYGISVNDVSDPAAAVSAITATLSSQQYDNVTGTGGSSSIGQGTTVTKNLLREFADSIRSAADNSITDPPDLSGNSDANNCVMIGTQNVCLGTQASPKVTYIATSSDTAWEVKGNISGVGLLVVDGENLTFKGNINWVGVVVVLGKNIGFTDLGGGNSQNIRGGLLVGEYSATDGGIDLSINGNVKITYSQEALNMVNTALRNNHKYSVISWQRVY